MCAPTRFFADLAMKAPWDEIPACTGSLIEELDGVGDADRDLVDATQLVDVVWQSLFLFLMPSSTSTAEARGVFEEGSTPVCQNGSGLLRPAPSRNAGMRFSPFPCKTSAECLFAHISDSSWARTSGPDLSASLVKRKSEYKSGRSYSLKSRVACVGTGGGRFGERFNHCPSTVSSVSAERGMNAVVGNADRAA